MQRETALALRVIILELLTQGFSFQDVESSIITWPFGAEGVSRMDRDETVLVMGRGVKGALFNHNTLSRAPHIYLLSRTRIKVSH